MKKVISILLMAAMTVSMLAGCNSTNSTNDTSSEASNGASTEASNGTPANFDASNEISVISREDGSGTRGAFIELFGVQVKGEDGSKVDMTMKDAIFVNNTEAVLTGVSGDEYAIGYISLGSLNNSVKALKVDGVDATAENVKNGTYTVARPFNIATKGEATGLTKDFIDFILSKEGQEVISGSCIAIDEAAPAYAGSKPEGKITVGGSSSVTPTMEKLIEAYKVLNPNATIELQSTDSTAGMIAAADGTVDIGMASRELKDSEKETLNGIQIALDGIAVIVNTANPLNDITKDQVKGIYTGETLDWSSLVK